MLSKFHILQINKLFLFIGKLKFIPFFHIKKKHRTYNELIMFFHVLDKLENDILGD